jgi:hypothetical protein
MHIGIGGILLIGLLAVLLFGSQRALRRLRNIVLWLLGIVAVLVVVLFVYAEYNYNYNVLPQEQAKAVEHQKWEAWAKANCPIKKAPGVDTTQDELNCFIWGDR